MNAAETYGVEDLRTACFQFARSFINVQSILPLYMTTLQQSHFSCTKELLSEVKQSTFLLNHYDIDILYNMIENTK